MPVAGDSFFDITFYASVDASGLSAPTDLSTELEIRVNGSAVGSSTLTAGEAKRYELYGLGRNRSGPPFEHLAAEVAELEGAVPSGPGRPEDVSGNERGVDALGIHHARHSLQRRQHLRLLIRRQRLEALDELFVQQVGRAAQRRLPLLGQAGVDHPFVGATSHPGNQPPRLRFRKLICRKTLLIHPCSGLTNRL